MTALIESKPLAYKGYRFRSRLEARWAVFFDAIYRTARAARFEFGETPR